MIEIPSAFSRRMLANSSRVSTSVSEEVGSSRIRILGPTDMAFRISTTWRLAMDSSLTGVRGPISSEPKRFSSFAQSS